MATLFSKIRVAALSTAHSILDKSIDLNSTEVVKQHTRDLETSMTSLGNSVAQERGGVIGAERLVGEYRSRIESFNEDIDAILSDGDDSNDHLAETLMSEQMGIEENLRIQEELLVTGKETVRVLEETLSALRGKHARMKQQIHKLRALENRASAKERAADAIRSASGALDTGVDASVDSVAARIQARADTADEKLKMAQESFHDITSGDAAAAQVKARLARRKQQLRDKK